MYAFETISEQILLNVYFFLIRFCTRMQASNDSNELEDMRVLYKLILGHRPAIGVLSLIGSILQGHGGSKTLVSS